jgi:mRNA interferase MazF
MYEGPILQEIPDCDGMPHDCAVNCDHIQTVSKWKVGALVTALSHAKMIEVRNAIRFALDP